MNHTLFFVLGLSLVAIALIVSFVGLRFERFPTSRGVLVGGTIAVAVLVGATMTFAWRNAEDEQADRDAELAADVTTNEESGDVAEADEEAGSAASGDTTAATTTTAASAAEGAKVFATAGCTGCHTLADAGSTATTGPNLDEELKGQSVAFIRTSIVDPNADIAKGFPPDLMPQNYSEQLTPEQLDAVVAYLSASTGGG